MRSADTHYVEFLCVTNGPKDGVTLQEGETVDKMYADRETILALVRSGKFVPCSYLQRMFEFC